MNKEVEAEGRYMTTILDPHIKVSDDYFVYKQGQENQKESFPAMNMFVKDPGMNQLVVLLGEVSCSVAFFWRDHSKIF